MFRSACMEGRKEDRVGEFDKIEQFGAPRWRASASVHAEPIHYADVFGVGKLRVSGHYFTTAEEDNVHK